MCKSALENIETEAPELLDRLPAPNLAQIRAASRADWLPAATLGEIYDGVLQVAGEQRLHTLNRAYTRKAFSFSVFGPLVKGATNLFGGGPKGLLRVMPNSWDLMTRDCGSLTVEFPSDGGGCKLSYAGLAPELRTPGFSVASAASPLGMLDALGFDGAIEVDDRQLDKGGLELHVRWTKTK